LEGAKKDIRVLANDTDEDGILDLNSIVIVRPPAHGQATASNGLVSYQPNLGFVGEDNFSYLVRDNSGFSSNDGRVSIDITERDFPYQNPINSLDVNGDGFIVPRDALMIINEINSRQFSDDETGEVTFAVQPPNRPAAYVDVTGDGFVASTDVLRVINFLNAQSAAAASPTANNQAAAAAFATNFDARSDGEDEETEG
jgi:hypothetical protein